MLETIKDHLGITRKPQDPPRFYALYTDINTQQLRNCNYPDQYFSIYSVNFSDKANIQYRLDLHTGVKWGTIQEADPNMKLSIWKKGIFQESQLPEILTTSLVLVDMVRAKSKIHCNMKADDDHVEVFVNLHSGTQDTQKALSTKSEIADFVDDLQGHDLFPIGWSCAYFYGMTSQELEECNLPIFRAFTSFRVTH